MLSGIFSEKTQTWKILVVDDEVDIAMVICKTLKLNGYEVITANDGFECVAKAENESPDLILLDNVMPNMDGPTTLAKLKASRKTDAIPVIMVTSLADDKNIVSAQKGGAIEYVVKPFDYEVLLGKITQALKSKSKRKAAIHE